MAASLCPFRTCLIGLFLLSRARIGGTSSASFTTLRLAARVPMPAAGITASADNAAAPNSPLSNEMTTLIRSIGSNAKPATSRIACSLSSGESGSSCEKTITPAPRRAAAAPPGKDPPTCSLPSTDLSGPCTVRYAPPVEARVPSTTKESAAAASGAPTTEATRPIITTTAHRRRPKAEPRQGLGSVIVCISKHLSKVSEPSGPGRPDGFLVLTFRRSTVRPPFNVGGRRKQWQKREHQPPATSTEYRACSIKALIYMSNRSL